MIPITKALFTGVLVAGRASPGGRLRSFDIAAIVQIDWRHVQRRPEVVQGFGEPMFSYQSRRTGTDSGIGVGVVEFTYPNIIAL